MDSGTVFYIIAVVIYFIYTALQQRKSKNKEVDGETVSDSPTSEAPARGSFDDILREIRKQQEERERDIVVAGERPNVPTESNDDEIFEPKEVTHTNYTPIKPASTYVDPYRSLSQSQPLVKLDDQVDIHEDVKILGEVKSTLHNQNANPYARLLKDPKTLVEAVVVSEILRRKHF